MCVLAFASAVGFVSWFRWDRSRNRGYTWGYWGEFNTVSNAVARLPGIAISKAYYNYDLTLEEFGFDILSVEKRTLHIGFEENDPTRELSGDELRAALLKQIREQSSKPATSWLDAPPK